MTNDKRQRLAAVIRALLAKTKDAGATEAEATAAAEKARELMDRHNIDQGALGMEAEGTGKARANAGKFGRLIVTDYIYGAVARFCDCKAWHTTGTKAYRHTFFGLQSDTEFATWLLESLGNQITGALRAAAPDYAHLHGRDRWEWQKAFLMGAAMRINSRLDALTRERKARQEQEAIAAGGDTSRALVAIKGAIVAKAYAALGLKLGTSRSSVGVNGGSGGYAAGRAAGDRARFGRPVGGNAAALRIGRS